MAKYLRRTLRLSASPGESSLATLDIIDLGSPLFGPVRLSAGPGEVVGLSGPSGAGKTLLLRGVADLDPTRGEVHLDGQPRSGFHAAAWRAAVGYLPAESQWWEERIGAHFQATADALHALGLPADALAWEVARCSTGERQRLALLRLLAGGPQVLLLDEPTASLDAAATAQVETYVLAYARSRGAPVLWVSHDAEQLHRVARRRFQVVPRGRLEPLA
jgi:ABC-type iron transport system FetAB ATPase subunit